MRKSAIQRRRLMFSLIFSLILTFLVVIVNSTFNYLSTIRELGKRNLETNKKIQCNGNSCDISSVEGQPGFQNSDYVITKNNYIIYSENFPNFSLNYSDPTFLKQFRKPTTWSAPINEVWRLLSREIRFQGEKLEIMVGWIEKANYLLENTPSTSLTDQLLNKEIDKIIKRLRFKNNEIYLSGIESKADAYEVIDSKTAKVIDWAWSIPANFPKNRKSKTHLFFIDNKYTLYIVRSDNYDFLSTTSLKPIGNIWLILSNIGLTYIFISLLVYQIVSRFFRKYFIFYQQDFPELKFALNSGEGQKVEFKRGIFDDELLKSVTAFANTNNGAVFVGVDDNGKVSGLDLNSTKSKDQFRDKIYNLTRQRIKPSLMIDVDFEDVRGLTVAKVLCPRGEEPLYFFDGLIYTRHGNSDIKAHPDLIKKILYEHSY